MQTFIGKDGFRFLDEREMHLTTRWFHYSPPETFSRMFRSPDWALWQGGEFEAAIETMRGLRKGPGREADRTQVWAANGVAVVRLQVVDAASINEPESPLNYLLTYLAVTHPDEDRLIIDSDKCAASGIALPDIDFLIHDDDAVFTKYEGEPAVIYRDAYFNRAPQPGEDDDRPMVRHYAGLADGLLSRREELAYQGSLFGIDIPGAHFIHLVREPAAVITSLLRRARDNPGMIGARHQSDQQNDEVVWRACLQATLRQHGKVNHLVVDSDAFVDNPEAEAITVAAFLDLPYRDPDDPHRARARLAATPSERPWKRDAVGPVRRIVHQDDVTLKPLGAETEALWSQARLRCAFL